jgi:hypothetical protein
MSLLDLKKLNEILAYRYDFESCDEPLKSQSKARYDQALDEILSRTPYSRLQLAEALAPRYREYCKAQRLQEKRRQP